MAKESERSGEDEQTVKRGGRTGSRQMIAQLNSCYYDT